MVDHLDGMLPSLSGKTVLELGCGHGLAAIKCLQNPEVRQACFQDYNPEVIETVTKPAVQMNLGDTDNRAVYLSGSWQSILDSDKEGELKEKFDLIIMCETLYNKDYYESLLGLIAHSLKPEGQVLIGTKTFYYGLGGGFYDFEQFCKNHLSNPMTCTILKKFNDLKSIERLIVSMTHAPKTSENAQMAQSESDEFKLMF